MRLIEHVGTKEMELREFKRQIACSLCEPQRIQYMAARKRPPGYTPIRSPKSSYSRRAALLGSAQSGRSIQTQPASTPPDSLPPIGVQDETPIPLLPIKAGDLSTHILMPNEFTKIESSNDESSENDSDSVNSSTRKRTQRSVKTKAVQKKKSPKTASKPRYRRGTCRGRPNPVTSYGCVDCGLPFHPECFSIYHNSAKCAAFNPECRKIHDRLQEYFSLYPKALEFGIDKEDAETPMSTASKKQNHEKQVNMCCKPKDVSMFEKHF